MAKKKRETVRIQKYLAGLGVASRRAVEDMVTGGLVSVNGRVVRKMPCFVDPDADDIVVNGSRVKKSRPRMVYYLLNKPRGVICTSRDPEGRPRAVDLIPRIRERVYCVGRLDADSTGLVLLTNDGELTNRLTHPKYGVKKTYLVNVPGRVRGEDVETLLAGGYVGGRRASFDSVRVLRRTRTSTLMEVVLREGRNRQIRRLLADLGYRVRRLTRVAIGNITDKGLKAGNFRMLSREEIRGLRRRAR
jgi:23S rRNA pseudouridine2605 synthase